MWADCNNKLRRNNVNYNNELRRKQCYVVTHKQFCAVNRKQQLMNIVVNNTVQHLMNIVVNNVVQHLMNIIVNNIYST